MRAVGLPRHWNEADSDQAGSLFSFFHKSLVVAYVHQYWQGAALVRRQRHSRWCLIGACLALVVGAALVSDSGLGVSQTVLAGVMAVGFQELRHRWRLRVLAQDISSRRPGHFFAHAQAWERERLNGLLEAVLPLPQVNVAPRRRL